MWLICTFVVNSGLSFLLGLVVAGILGPEEYGRFAVASMTAIVLGTLLFDWLRLSATRFYTTLARDETPALRASLDGGYLGAALFLAAIVLALLALGIDLGLTAPILAVAAIAAAANGGFEYSAARARALFLNRAYAQIVILKNAFAFVSMIAAGLLFGSAAWVLGMMALSSAAAALTVRGPLRDRNAPLATASRERLMAFARYGWPIVGANLAYQGIVLVNRVVATSTFGYAAGGQLSLATDVTIRLFLSAGAALDVFLFQVAVRRSATAGILAGQRQVARNMVLVSAVLVLLAVGFVGAMPAFEALFVPLRFRGDFGRISVVLVPGVLAFCLIQFALSPVFQVAGRTSPVLWTALGATLVDLGVVMFIPASAGLISFAWLHSVSLIAGFALAAWQASRIEACRPSLRDTLAVLVAAIVAAAAIWPTRAIPVPWLSLVAATAIGTSLYLAILVAFDVADLRGVLRRAAGSVGRLMPMRLARDRV